MLRLNYKCTFLLLIFISLLFSQNVISPIPAQNQVTLSLDPQQYSAKEVGETFTISIKISNVQNLWGWVAAVTWNPEYISPAGDPTEGDFMKKAGSTLFLAAPAMKEGYYPEISCFLMLERGASGDGTLATLAFKILKPCVQTPIRLVNTTLISVDVDPKTGEGYKISHTVLHSTTSVSLVVGGAPIADAGEDQTVAEGTIVIFNGSRSHPINENLTYTWSFFDGAPKTLNGQIANYTFEVPGVYEVTLTVKNSAGAASEAKIKITVTDITPPVPVILINNEEPGRPIPVGQRVEFSGVKSYDPEDGKIVEYRWQIGPSLSIFSVNATHTFEAVGVYNVSLTVFDQRGNNSATKTIKVNVVAAGQDAFSSGGASSSSRPFTLPPPAIIILTILTAATIIGSAFWLRKRQFTTIGN